MEGWLSKMGSLRRNRRFFRVVGLELRYWRKRPEHPLVEPSRAWDLSTCKIQKMEIQCRFVIKTISNDILDLKTYNHEDWVKWNESFVNISTQQIKQEKQKKVSVWHSSQEVRFARNAALAFFQITSMCTNFKSCEHILIFFLDITRRIPSIAGGFISGGILEFSFKFLERNVRRVDLVVSIWVTLVSTRNEEILIQSKVKDAMCVLMKHAGSRLDFTSSALMVIRATLLACTQPQRRVLFCQGEILNCAVACQFIHEKKVMSVSNDIITLLFLSATTESSESTLLRNIRDEDHNDRGTELYTSALKNLLKICNESFDEKTLLVSMGSVGFALHILNNQSTDRDCVVHYLGHLLASSSFISLQEEQRCVVWKSFFSISSSENSDDKEEKDDDGDEVVVEEEKRKIRLDVQRNCLVSKEDQNQVIEMIRHVLVRLKGDTVYKQGLDSVALTVSKYIIIKDEPEKFIVALIDFFELSTYYSRDEHVSSQFLFERLSFLNALLWFHSPRLCASLRDQGLGPELYAGISLSCLSIFPHVHTHTHTHSLMDRHALRRCILEFARPVEILGCPDFSSCVRDKSTKLTSCWSINSHGRRAFSSHLEFRDQFTLVLKNEKRLESETCGTHIKFVL